MGNHPAAQHQSFDAAEVGHRIPLLRDTSMRRFSRGGKALRAAEGGVSSAALTRCVEAGRACEKRGGMKGEEARYLEIAGRRVFHCRLVVRLDHVLQRSAASTPRHVSNSVQSDRRGLDVPVCPVVGCVEFAHGYPCTAGSGAPGTLESNVEALAVLLVDQVLHQDSRLAPPHQRSHPLIATPLTPLNSVCCSISSGARTAGGLLTLLTSRSGWRT